MNRGKVWFVGAGPGNPELITLRGHELLKHADVIIHDSGISPDLFHECRFATRRVDTGCVGCASPSELSAIAQQIIREAQAGAAVVRLKTGDPLFYSRALDEMDALCAAGVPFEIVPGVASPLAAAAYAGVPLTGARGFGSLAFFSATDAMGNTQDLKDLEQRALTAESICVMLLGNQLKPVVERLQNTGRFGDATAVLVYKASLPEQRVIEAPLGELLNEAEPSAMPEPTLLIVSKLTDWRKKLNWFESLPLFGKRLLVCRPLQQSQESARAIWRRGAAPLILPLIEIEPIADNTALAKCLPHLNEYEWVIFTSANGVEQLRQAIAAAGLDARAFGRAKIAVIGPGTAKPFEKWGITPDLVAEEHVAEGLASQILAVGPAKSALLIRALEARDVLPSFLRAAGLDVTIVAAYRTRKLADETRHQLKHQLQAKLIDAVLLTSSSMADALVKALAPDAPTLLSNVCVASIGPITTQTLLKAGIEASLTASTYTVEGLLDALESHFERE